MKIIFTSGHTDYLYPWGNIASANGLVVFLLLPVPVHACFKPNRTQAICVFSRHLPDSKLKGFHFLSKLLKVFFQVFGSSESGGVERPGASSSLAALKVLEHVSTCPIVRSFFALLRMSWASGICIQIHPPWCCIHHVPRVGDTPPPSQKTSISDICHRCSAALPHF